MAKYEALTRALLARAEDAVRLTFDETDIASVALLDAVAARLAPEWG